MGGKKKYINLRLFFIGFLGMIFGILFFYNLLNVVFTNRFNIWVLLFGVVFALVLFFIILSIFKDKLKRYLKYLIIFGLLFVISGSIFCGKINNWKSYATFEEKDNTIVGTVSSIYLKENHYVINLERVNTNEVSIDGEMVLYVTLDEDVKTISLGDRIITNGEINLKTLVDDKINIEDYVDNKVYSSRVTISGIEIVKENKNIIYKSQEKLKDTLESGLSNENASFAYGILVGDKGGLDADIKQTFSYAGISHLLAVSGLHVGFLVAIITFLLNLLRVGRRNRFVITSVILLFYSVFCNLSPSILRASLMAIIILLAGVLGEEYDGLNSLGLAGIIILLLFPEDLFSLGFQLSFLCVFMIITLGDVFSRLLKSWGVPKFFAVPVAISISVTIGTSIIIANSIGEVSLISVVSNLIVIPIFSITYPLLFLCSLIAMIPIFNGILIFPQILLHIVKLVANFFAGLNIANFRVFNLGYMLLFVFLLLSFIVKFVMINIKWKSIISLVLLSVCLSLTIIGLKPKQYNNYAIHTYYQYSSSSVLFTGENNEKYLVGYDKYNSLNFLKELKINNLDMVVLQDFEINNLDEYTEFFKRVKTKKLVIPYHKYYREDIFKDLSKYVEINYVLDYKDDICVKFIISDELVCGTLVEINNNRLLFPNGISKEKLNNISTEVDKVDYIVVNASKYDFEDYGIKYEYLIHSNSLDFENNNAISLKNKSHYVLQLKGRE